jgi:hypothetical protein
MRRRAFIAGLGGVAAWPVVALNVSVLAKRQRFSLPSLASAAPDGRSLNHCCALTFPQRTQSHNPSGW